VIGHGHQRLAADMLTDCAAELRRKSEECEALRVENALLTVRLRVMEIRAGRLRAGKRM
jgi:hypothetical protein